MTASIQIIRNEQQLLAWKPQWLELFCSGNPIDAAASYHQLANDLCHLMGFEGGNCAYLLHQKEVLLAVIVISPARIRLSGKIPINVLESGGHFVSDMLIAPAVTHLQLNLLFETILKEHQKAAFLSFNRLSTQQAEALKTCLAASKFNVLQTYNTESYQFDAHSINDEQFHARFGKKTRRNMRYYQRLLEREHQKPQFCFVIPKSLEQNEALLKTFLDLEQSGWKGEQSSAILDQEKTLKFYSTMTHCATSTGQMMWAQCKLGEETIAMMLVMNRGDKIWAQKTAYNQEYQRYSPGALLNYQLIRYAIEDPSIQSLDMVTNYKWLERWKPIKAEYTSLRVFNSGVAGWLVYQIHKLTNKLWKELGASS